MGARNNTLRFSSVGMLLDLRLVVAATALLPLPLSGAAAAGSGGTAPLRSVLLVVIDDLRPQLKTYGVEWMHTP